jgi:hypothetical protein
MMMSTDIEYHKFTCNPGQFTTTQISGPCVLYGFDFSSTAKHKISLIDIETGNTISTLFAGFNGCSNLEWRNNPIFFRRGI